MGVGVALQRCTRTSLLLASLLSSATNHPARSANHAARGYS